MAWYPSLFDNLNKPQFWVHKQQGTAADSEAKAETFTILLLFMEEEDSGILKAHCGSFIIYGVKSKMCRLSSDQASLFRCQHLVSRQIHNTLKYHRKYKYIDNT